MEASPDHAEAHRVKGKLKRFVGWLMADRRVEAEGQAEQQARTAPEPEALDEAEQDVKGRYGETPEG